MKIQNQSWCALLVFCGWTSLMASLGFAAVFTGGAVAFASSDTEQAQKTAPAGDQTFSGMITDSQCGARHDRFSGRRPAECVRMCARNGSKYMLVNGDQENILEGNEMALDHLAGQRVTITGTLNGKNIKVTSVAPIQ